MSLSIDPNRYRREADRCRRRAATATDKPSREEWAGLALEYDCLAGSADALSVMHRPKKAEQTGRAH